MILIIRILYFLYLKKIINRLNKKNSICINVFCYKNCLTYPVHITKQKLEDHMDLLLIKNEDKIHYVYIKDFNIFMFHKTKHKKHTFADIAYNVLVVKEFW